MWITLLPQWLGYGKPCCKLGVQWPLKGWRSLYGAGLDDWRPWWPTGEVIPDIRSEIERTDQLQCSLIISIQFSLRFVKYNWIISETYPYDIPSKSAIFHLHRLRADSTLKFSPFFIAKPHCSSFRFYLTTQNIIWLQWYISKLMWIWCVVAAIGQGDSTQLVASVFESTEYIKCLSGMFCRMCLILCSFSQLSLCSLRKCTVAEKGHRKNNYIVRKKIFENEQKIFMSGPRLIISGTRLIMSGPLENYVRAPTNFVRAPTYYLGDPSYYIGAPR